MRVGAAVLVFALVWLAFGPALGADFVHFDDDLVLLLNPHFRGFAGEQLGWMFTTGYVGHYQPLTWLTFALDWTAAGLDPARFHGTNVLLHALTGVAFYFVALELLKRAVPGATAGRRVAAALAAALLFAAHPLRAESVAWVTERRDVLSSALLLVAVYAWLRAAPAQAGRFGAGRGAAVTALALGGAGMFLAGVDLDPRYGTFSLRGLGPGGIALAAICLGAAGVVVSRGRGGAAWYALALSALALSLLSKAWGIVFPAVVLILDVWPLRRLRSLRDAPALVIEKLPFVGLSAMFMATARWAQASQAGTMKSLAEHSLVERGLQSAYGLVWYPLKTAAPLALAPIYELPATLSASEPRFLVPLIVVPVVTLALVLLARRAPALLASWAAFVVIVSPVLGLAQSGPQLVADRYSYLSCLPFALLVAGAWLARPARPLATGVLVLLVLASGWLTYVQVGYWRSDAALWERAHALRPDSPVALYQLGAEYERQGRLEESRALLERGFELDDDPRFLAAMALHYERRADAEPENEAAHRAQALEYSRRAYVLGLESNRFLPEYRLSYAVNLWNAGRRDEALGHFEWYAAAHPARFQGRFYTGASLRAVGRPRDAIGHLEAAVRLEPTRGDAWNELALAREAIGDAPGAAQARRRASGQRP
jgi:tetratricopeptide (TPR) repeat protein